MEAIKKKLAELKKNADKAEKDATALEEEYKEKVRLADEMEQRREEKMVEVDELERELETIEDKIQDYLEQLAIAEKYAEEGRQARKLLENRSQDDDKRIAELEAEYEDIIERNKAVVEKLVRVQANLDESDEILDEEERRLDIALMRDKELEADVTQQGNALRSMRVNEQIGIDRVSTKNEQIETKSREIELVLKKALEFEDLCHLKTQECDDKERELEEAKSRHAAAKEELESIIAELGDLII